MLSMGIKERWKTFGARETAKMQISIYSVESLQSFLSKVGPNLHPMAYKITIESKPNEFAFYDFSQSKSLCRFKKDFGFNVTILETRG